MALRDFRGWSHTQFDDSYEGLRTCLLMEIRNELQALNRVMQCENVFKGFRALAKIAERDERTFKRRVAEAARKRIKRRAA